jgi:hypothetical protein
MRDARRAVAGRRRSDGYCPFSVNLEQLIVRPYCLPDHGPFPYAAWLCVNPCECDGLPGGEWNIHECSHFGAIMVQPSSPCRCQEGPNRSRSCRSMPRVLLLSRSRCTESLSYLFRENNSVRIERNRDADDLEIRGTDPDLPPRSRFDHSHGERQPYSTRAVISCVCHPSWSTCR